jgi:hypothetical protein
MINKILEDGRLQVIVPIKFRTISARKRIVIPGSPADDAEPLVRQVARAFRWQRYIDEGKFKNIVELASAIGQNKATVAATLRLQLLSPVIVHRIITGDVPRTLNLSKFRTSIPDVLKDQEERWIGGEAMSWGDE